MNGAILEIKDLKCGYSSKPVLHDVSFTVKRGEFMGIVGPNGSGKTTLLRTVTRIIRPEYGKILFEGEDVWKIQLRELAKKIAVVSQTFDIGVMSVEEFVLLGRAPYYKRFQLLETKKDLEIAKRCMDLTDTLKFKDQLIGQISGGERQLALIGRALAQEPSLLLLDEPTAHLDIAHQVGILDLVKRLNRNFGLTVIVVLHDLNLASEYCDRMVLLNNGIVSKIGSPHEVLKFETIEKAYNTIVVVKKNPVTGRPYIFLVPGSKEKT